MCENDLDRKDSTDNDDPWYVREVDDHTGVADSQGVPYTYEHVDEPPEPQGEAYRVETFIDFSERPTHKNVYFIPAGGLDEFFRGYGQTFEEVVDIRPVSYEEAEAEFTSFDGE